MSLVDLQLWVFKLFRLHPQTQDLHIKGFFKQHKSDTFDEEEPDWYLEYYPWEDNYEFFNEKCWRSFANKLKKKRNVTQKFMLYVDSSEIRHYGILLKAVNDDYSQQVPIVLPGTESLASCQFPYRYCKEHLPFTAKEMAVYLTGHGKQVTPAEAWRARQMALEAEFGTFYESHNFAPRLLKKITCQNPGGFVDIQDAEVSESKDFRVLQRIFWAFGQCLQAFGTCRPVLCIKGTPLCGKYQGVLLTAVALDANDLSIPVAYAIVEGETKESWLWFLRNLERAVVLQAGVCIIHDYKKELIDAIEDLLNSRQRQWRKVESRWCMEHLAENFFSYFGDKNLVMMFKKLCQQKQRPKFDKLWKELDELTSKYIADKECGASEEVQQGSVRHDEAELQEDSPCSQPDSVDDGMEGDRAANNEGKITKFSDWILLKPLEKWSLRHDRNGARYGIMGTDITDVYKNDPVLKGIPCLPISGIVEVTFMRLEEYFKNTSGAANKAIDNPSVSFPERVQDDMNCKMQKVGMYQVVGGEESLKFTVKSRQRQVTVNMKLEYTHNMDKPKGSTTRKTATCSCNKPQLLHKPCSHVIAVCCHIGVSTAEYMSPYYSLTYLGMIWSKTFNKFSRNYNIFLPCYFRYIIPLGRETPTWIPDKRLECGFPGYLLSDRVGTAIVDEEQQCRTEDKSVADNEGTNTHSEEPSQI